MMYTVRLSGYPLIQDSLMDLLGFRAPHNAACLILILKNFSPIEIG